LALFLESVYNVYSGADGKKYDSILPDNDFFDFALESFDCEPFV